jgi:hypothetical protein
MDAKTFLPVPQSKPTLSSARTRSSVMGLGIPSHFLIELVGYALIRNPLPKLGIGRISEWYEAVIELYLVFTQLMEVVTPLRVSNSSIISSFKSRCIETWLVLVLALAISNALSFWSAFRRSYP